MPSRIIKSKEFGQRGRYLSLIELLIAADLPRSGHVRSHGKDKNVLGILDIGSV